MKICTVSDIHGSLTHAQKAVEAFHFHQADLLVILGDYLYHGPRNPLPEGYSPKDVAELLNGLKSSILGIRGNCDSEVDQMVLDFDIMAEHTTLMLDSHRIFAAHGHHHDPEALDFLNPGDVFLYGHVHLPIAEKRNGITVLNPGSISLPKGGNPNSYGLFDQGRFTIYSEDHCPLTSIEL